MAKELFGWEPAAEAEVTDEEGESVAHEVTAEDAISPRLDRFSDFTQRIVDDRAAQDAEVLDSALTQATRVAWLCGALVLTGVIIEVVRFTG